MTFMLNLMLLMCFITSRQSVRIIILILTSIGVTRQRILQAVQGNLSSCSPLHAPIQSAQTDLHPFCWLCSFVYLSWLFDVCGCRWCPMHDGLLHVCHLVCSVAVHSTFLLCHDFAIFDPPFVIVCLLPAVSSLYIAPPQPPSLEAVPSDKDFATALRALGLDTNAAADKSSSDKDGLKAPDTHAVVKGTLYHLQLLLRTFAAVCRYQQQVTIVLYMAACVNILLDVPLLFSRFHHAEVVDVLTVSRTRLDQLTLQY